MLTAGHKSFSGSDAVLPFESAWQQRDLFVFHDGPLWDLGPVTWKEFKEQNDSIITKYLFIFFPPSYVYKKEKKY